MEELKKEIAKLLIKYIEENALWELVLYSFLFIFFCMGAGAFVQWLWKRHKIKAEVGKIIKESEKIAAEIMEKRRAAIKDLQSYRKAYNKKLELFNISIASLVDEISKQNTNEVKVYREEVIHQFSNEVAPSFIEYAEIADATYSKEEKKFFVKNEINHFLNTSANFLEAVNLEIILDILSISPAFLSKETMASLYSIAEPNFGFFRCSEKKGFYLAKKRIEKYQQ